MLFSDIITTFKVFNIYHSKFFIIAPNWKIIERLNDSYIGSTILL